MSIEIKVPTLPESISEAFLAVWHVKEGDYVKEGDNLVDLETDKVTLEVPATKSGIINNLLEEGVIVTAGEVLANINEGAAPPTTNTNTSKEIKTAEPAKITKLAPSVKVLVEENHLNIENIPASGKEGRHTKGDILEYLESQNNMIQPSLALNHAVNSANLTQSLPAISFQNSGESERVPLSPFRQIAANKLLSTQNNTATLTIVEEVNLSTLKCMKKRYKKLFKETHGTSLSYTAFFVKAVTEALKSFPAINSSIDHDTILYHKFYDIGIELTTQNNSIVPIVRSADQKSIAAIEIELKDYKERANDGVLSVEELSGGTFTIATNSSESLLTTAFINPPQSALLSLHKVTKKAVVINNEITIAPMMYLTLAYDYRLIDKQEAEGFMKLVKSVIEDPTRLLLSL